MEILSWNWVLIVVGIIAVINIINGFKTGFVKELINCISLLVLSVSVILLSSVIKSYSDKEFIQMLTMIIMVLIVAIAHKLLKKVLEGIDAIASLPVVSIVNKIAGAVFGVAETVLVVWFVLCLIGLFDLGQAGEYIYMYIGNNPILSYLYQNNLLAMVGEIIRGPEFQMKAMEIILEQSKEIAGSVL